MPPYDLIGIQDVLFIFGVGLGLTLAVILARGSRRFGFSLVKKAPVPEKGELHEFGGGVSETHRPVPLLVWLVFVGYFVWAASYVLFVGARGL